MSLVMQFTILLHKIQQQQNKLEIINSSSSKPETPIFDIIQKEYDEEFKANPDKILLIKYKYFWKNELFAKICKGQNVTEELKSLDKCYSKKTSIFFRCKPTLDFQYANINNEQIKCYEWIKDNTTYWFIDLFEIFNLEIFKKVNIFSLQKHVNQATKENLTQDEMFQFGIEYVYVKTEGFERCRPLISARGIYKLLNEIIDKGVFDKIFKDRFENNFRDISRILSIASKLSYSFYN